MLADLGATVISLHLIDVASHQLKNGEIYMDLLEWDVTAQADSERASNARACPPRPGGRRAEPTPISARDNPSPFLYPHLVGSRTTKLYPINDSDNTFACNGDRRHGRRFPRNALRPDAAVDLLESLHGWYRGGRDARVPEVEETGSYHRNDRTPPRDSHHSSPSLLFSTPPDTEFSVTPYAPLHVSPLTPTCSSAVQRIPQTCAGRRPWTADDPVPLPVDLPAPTSPALGPRCTRVDAPCDEEGLVALRHLLQHRPHTGRGVRLLPHPVGVPADRAQDKQRRPLRGLHTDIEINEMAQGIGSSSPSLAVLLQLPPLPPPPALVRAVGPRRTAWSALPASTSI
ncbi:hypothetical protein DFH06DRAFT_1333424 [Mycena polygramma]|nr:hypothetical protein DFH06DRAFT_1333424 [Mycena polygramma]